MTTCPNCGGCGLVMSDTTVETTTPVNIVAFPREALENQLLRELNTMLAQALHDVADLAATHVEDNAETRVALANILRIVNGADAQTSRLVTLRGLRRACN